MTPWAALAVSASLAGIGRSLRWLTTGGAVAATIVGTTILAAAGVEGLLLLAFFFVSGSILSYQAFWQPDRRTATAPTPGRTWRQVTANGGVAAAGALLLPWIPEVAWAIVTGALAAAQADTWSTEVGRLARKPPRLITSGRPVPTGTSGAISPLGTAAGVAGATVMAGCALFVGVPQDIAVATAIGGTVGFLGDSVLGATAQASYRCDTCAMDGERPVHTCGRSAPLVRGYRWIDNDVVNLVATVVGAGIAVGLLVIGG